MYCLWCHEEIILDITWKNIVILSKRKHLCHKCEQQLERLEGARCERCSRSSDQSFCADCLWWDQYFQQENKLDPLTFNFSLYSYNEQIQLMITKWKYRGDFVLAKSFEDDFTASFHSMFSTLMDAVAVPIPLSKERLLERGFNQAKVLADFLPIQTKELLSRNHSEKQAKKTRFERVSARNPFFLQKRINKPVILVDDIYTTGATIRHAATLLREQGCPKVYAYTLIRG